MGLQLNTITIDRRYVLSCMADSKKKKKKMTVIVVRKMLDNCRI